MGHTHHGRKEEPRKKEETRKGPTRRWHFSWALKNGSESDRKRHTGQARRSEAVQHQELTAAVYFEKDLFMPLRLSTCIFMRK